MKATQPRFAVIGHPVNHSRSPDIHAAFAQQTSIELTYERLDALPMAFETCVAQFFSDKGRGLNVTVPFKERAWQLAQSNLSDRAKQAGAVNTLWTSPQGLHGCNTDGIGLVRDLQRLALLIPNARVLLLGAGGAAKGVLGPLLEAGCEHLHVANRTADRALSLRQAWIEQQPAVTSCLTAGSIGADLTDRSWDLVINATASSLQGQSLELPAGLFSAKTSAYDMMYGEQPTLFLQQATQQGATRVADGLGMLVEQAAESFRIWHGTLPEVTPVINAIRAQMSSAVR